MTVDTARLDSLPDGAGYTILAQEVDDLADTFRRLGARGMFVTGVYNQLCDFDPDHDRIVIASGAHPPGEVEMRAYRVTKEGQEAEVARSRGWPVTHTQVQLRRIPLTSNDDFRAVTWIIEDDLTAEQVEGQVVRAFSAGQQIGVRLSCVEGGC